MFSVWIRGKSFVRIHTPGMHCSGPRPKSHCGSPDQDVVADLRRRPQPRLAVPAAESPDGWQTIASCWPFALPGRRVAVVEGDDEVAVRKHDRVRALVEVAGARAQGWIEGVAEDAEARRVAVDLLRRRPGLCSVGRHRAVDRRLPEVAARVVEELRPGHVDVVAGRMACGPRQAIGGDEVLVADRVGTVGVVLDDEEPLGRGARDRAREC